VDVALFQRRFKQFKNTYPDVVSLVLAEAALQCDASVYRQMTDSAVAYLAAHLLAIDPQGQDTRLKASELEGTLSTTTYGRRFMDIREMMTVGVAVSGGWRGGWGC
jgi:hypothetical protein